MNLCQPDHEKSCGACCGLYNYVDSSRASLTLRLRRRTERFWRIREGGGDPRTYVEQTRQEEDFRKRYEVIYCCEFLGFLDKEEKRVGCLLHPSLHGGEEKRGLSFYGQELCAGHFCPSYQHLTENQKKILVQVLDDWYLYGLCLTDIDLVRTYFRLLADRVGEEIRAERLTDETLKDMVREFFSWKISWPFRSEEIQRLGKYFFDGVEYGIGRIEYERLGRPPSPFHPILLSFSSTFRSGAEVERAEALIRSHMDGFVRHYVNLDPLRP